MIVLRITRVWVVGANSRLLAILASNEVAFSFTRGRSQNAPTLDIRNLTHISVGEGFPLPHRARM